MREEDEPGDQEPTPEELEAWPNCVTPDCENKWCDWSGTPFCFPCAERRLGRARMIELFNATHDTSWEKAEKT